MNIFLNDWVQIDHNDTKKRELVKPRGRDAFGNLIRESHSDPLLDTILYEVDFSDGVVINILRI